MHDEKNVDIYPVDILFGPAIKYEVFKTGVGPGDRVTREDILRLEKYTNDSAKRR